jgi:uncharacterized protein
MQSNYIIRDEAALLAVYGGGNEASLLKEIDHIHPHYRAFIEASSYCILASVGPEGVDASPRGDPAGFVVVEDEHTLLIPDRRGNNRVDTLHNLVVDPRVGLLFLVPGVGETLRVNGTAAISVDPALIERFKMAEKPARSVIIVKVETAYYHCPRAAVRSDLWNPQKFLPRSALPSSGTMLADFSGNRSWKDRDQTREAVLRATLY